MSTYTWNQNHRVFDFFNCMEEKDRYWFPRPDVYIFQGQDYLHYCGVDNNFPEARKVSYVEFLQNICESHGVFRIWIEFILADFF